MVNLDSILFAPCEMLLKSTSMHNYANKALPSTTFSMNTPFLKCTCANREEFNSTNSGPMFAMVILDH